MEINEAYKNIDRSYYLTNGESDFSRINQIINYLSCFQVAEVNEYEFCDTYYETDENFLKELDATIRVRKMPKTQTLSIVCKNLGERREFEMEMEYGSKIQDKTEYILFLEDKIQDIYTRRIDVDVVRVLNHLKPFLKIYTKRKACDIIDNREFKAEVDFDLTRIETKRHVETLYIVEVKNRCYFTAENEKSFERFVKEIEKKVVMIPMGEHKLDAGLRVFKREW